MCVSRECPSAAKRHRLLVSFCDRWRGEGEAFNIICWSREKDERVCLSRVRKEKPWSREVEAITCIKWQLEMRSVSISVKRAIRGPKGNLSFPLNNITDRRLLKQTHTNFLRHFFRQFLLLPVHLSHSRLWTKLSLTPSTSLFNYLVCVKSLIKVRAQIYLASKTLSKRTNCLIWSFNRTEPRGGLTSHTAFYSVDELVGFAAVQQGSNGRKRIQDDGLGVSVNVVLEAQTRKHFNSLHPTDAVL